MKIEAMANTQTTRLIRCCGCGVNVNARLTSGAEIYPHRTDLHSLPFWKCDGCGNYVGCHHKTKDRTNPLGCIPTPELRTARRELHDQVVDRLWKTGIYTRNHLYEMISKHLGFPFHTGNLRSMDEVNRVREFCKGL